jgi:PAS domain S-box-containing protein
MSKFPPEKTQPSQQENTTAEVLRQAHFEAFFAGANAGMLIFDSQLRYVQVNQAMAELNGICVADHIGMSLREVVPELAPTVEPMLQGILDTGKPILDYEVAGETPKQPGILRYWETSYYPLLDENNLVFGVGGIVIEVSDRKRAEQKQARLTAILEATSDLVGVCDSAGHSVYLNKAGQKMLGMSPEEARSPFSIDSVLAPSVTAKFHDEAFSTALREGSWAGETLFLSRDGQEIPVSQVLIVHKTEAGEVEFISTVARDIRDRKKAEEALREQQAALRDRNALLNSILESTPDIIVVKDRLGRYVAINSTLANFLGKPIEEIIGKNDLELLPPDTAREMMAKERQIMAAGITESYEEDVSGGEKTATFFTTKAPWRDANGNTLGIIATTRDITDRKQAEDTIKQSEERYRSLILAASQIVWTGDSEGRCWDMPTFRAYTGQTVDEVVGLGWLDAIHPDDSERTAQVWMEAVQTKSLYDIEYRIRGADGNYRYFQGRGVPILNEDGSIREWVGTCTDIHDRKQTELLMAKAKEAAEAANRAKSEFLANMSHELRTPLNGIMGYAQILQRSKLLNEEERSRIDVIYQCGSHLLTLINDILDLSKIEAQKVELMPTDFHFPAFLQGVAEMCRIRAELKGIQFHFPSAPELPIGIHADEKRLRQVLINLLSNAIKFTDAGSVTFIVSFATEAKIRFEIRDTGTGIAQHQLQTIFQPFEQVGDRRRQTEGTGLGLAISKRIVELMGSTIQVQSEMNVGSIFWFDVDLYQAEEWVKTSQIDHRGQIIGIKDRQPKIVVIDDKWANRSVISNLLSPIGFEVSEANDGQEGWEKILEVQPDLIVTDLLMPELDGYELIKRVRDSEKFKDIVIIVSSASVFETDQYRSLEAGGNTFIPKPVQATELLEKLQKYLDLEWVYEANEAPLAIASDTNELISPPATEMEILYELAMKGNFREIVKQAVLLEEIDPKYIPFAKKLHQMAKDFQDEEILTFIHSYK